MENYTELQKRAFHETSLHPNVIMAMSDEELAHELEHQLHEQPETREEETN